MLNKRWRRKPLTRWVPPRLPDRVIETILVVDDDKQLLTAWVRSFESAGKRTLAATNYDEAIQQAQVCKPDLAVVDLVLPGRDGIELTSALKALHSELRVIVVSGKGTVPYAVAAINAGAHNFFLKPVRPGFLLKVAQYGSSKQPLCDRTLSPTLDEYVNYAIDRALQDSVGNITHAAALLGIERTTLQRKLRKRQGRI